MKVLHICSYYIGSKLYKNLIMNLDELGIYNEVYIPVNSEDLIDVNYQEGLKNSNFIYSKNFNKLDRFSFKTKTKKIYQDLLNKVDLDSVDIIHAHSLFINGYIAYKLKKEKNIDYIVAIRNTDVNVFFKYMPHMRKLGIKIMNNAKKVIFISPAYKKNVIEKYVPKELGIEFELKSIVIPNGIEKFWIENQNYLNIEKRNKKGSRIKLLYVGSFNKNKNILSIVKSLKILKKDGYDIELNLVGSGRQYNKLKHIERKNKEIIKIYKFMDKEKLIELYRNADIFVMPSKYETFGLVYVESISQGTPIIYSKKQGFDGFFNIGEVGYSVVYNNIYDICSKIKIIIDNREQYFDISSKCKNFDWNIISQKYIEIYND